MYLFAYHSYCLLYLYSKFSAIDSVTFKKRHLADHESSPEVSGFEGLQGQRFEEMARLSPDVNFTRIWERREEIATVKNGQNFAFVSFIKYLESDFFQIPMSRPCNH